jgi:trehalose 6-phosphate synthase
MAASKLVVVSNRGPLSFSRQEDGRLEARRGAGGVVSSLGPLLAGTEALWIAAASSDEDRAAASDGLTEAEGFRYLPVVVDPVDHRMAYDVISNATLWFLHHGLFDLARRPHFDRQWREAWEAYQLVNRAFASAVVDNAPPGATVLVQDYHLPLLATELAEQRGDLKAVHFTHTPFAGPDAMRVLPDDVSSRLLEGMAAHRACGFHSRRWADAFVASCRDLIGREVEVFVAPLGPDAAHLSEVAGSPGCADHLERMDQMLGSRQLVLRVDRMELSKNHLRALLAFDELLHARPDWRGQVVLMALAYASREGLADYIAYRTEVGLLAERVNRRWATSDWTPVVLHIADDYSRSIAALTRYDVLLVNPVRDGLNLVAKEGPLLNRRHGVLALSREAGAWDELGEVALEVNPFDVAGTARVIAAALDLGPSARAERSSRLAEAAGARTPRLWLDDQLAAVGH